MKINLSKIITKLDDKEALVKDKSAGYVLANYLMDMSTAKPMKMFKLAVDLLEDKDIEIDKKDYDELVSIVETSQMANIFKAKILIELTKE